MSARRSPASLQVVVPPDCVALQGYDNGKISTRYGQSSGAGGSLSAVSASDAANPPAIAQSAPALGPRSVDVPEGNPDERELLLAWLNFLRDALVRKLDGLDDERARWRPDGRLISLLGIINHLTHVEWRWIDGGMRGETTSRSEEEFQPGTELSVAAAIAAYRARAAATDAYVRSVSLAEPCLRGHGRDLRWVLLHLINETARHAGHADSTRELLDGTTGE